MEGDDWRDHHPDWINEVAYNQQCQEKLQKEREQRWICDARWCDSEGRDCYDGPPPHHLKYGTSSVGSEVKKCIFSQVPDECRGRYNYACCKHKPSGEVVFGIVFPIIIFLMLVTAAWPYELPRLGERVSRGNLGWARRGVHRSHPVFFASMPGRNSAHPRRFLSRDRVVGAPRVDVEAPATRDATSLPPRIVLPAFRPSPPRSAGDGVAHF